MDIKQKLQEEVDNYNKLLVEEQTIQQRLDQVHDQRIQAFGRVQAVDALFKEELAEASVAANANGHDEGALSEVERVLAEQPQAQNQSE